MWTSWQLKIPNGNVNLKRLTLRDRKAIGPMTLKNLNVEANKIPLGPLSPRGILSYIITTTRVGPVGQVLCDEILNPLTLILYDFPISKATKFCGTVPCSYICDIYITLKGGN